MKLEKIITLASEQVRIPFLAMVRSLREVGCNLPIWVIPYDDNKFELPENCRWWEILEISEWLQARNQANLLKKYQALTEANYQFVDSDVIFLQNPEEILSNHNGFITSCGHWHNPDHSLTPESEKVFMSLSTTWQKWTFNSGQFACDQQLYSAKELIGLISNQYPDTFQKCQVDQPSINLATVLSGVKISNLTLPPYNMESTWAGDYLDRDHELNFNTNTSPYLIHWAGTPILSDKSINNVFFKYITPEEKEYFMKKNQPSLTKNSIYMKLKNLLKTFRSN